MYTSSVGSCQDVRSSRRAPLHDDLADMTRYRKVVKYHEQMEQD